MDVFDLFSKADDMTSGRFDFASVYERLSDLFEINLTEVEIAETAHYDATCQYVERRRNDDPRPMGKRVY